MNRWSKNIASWKCGKTLYLSVVFTWQLGQAKRLAKIHKGRVVAGGPAVKLMGADWADEVRDSTPFDVLSMHNPCATFTTRGCPNACPFCAVPKTEGDFRELATWKPAPLVCDNNLLAASRKHFGRVVDSLVGFPLVDFNQGLSAQLLKPWHLDQIGRLQSTIVRFAFDHIRDEQVFIDAVRLCRSRGVKDVRAYVLIGFDDTPEDAHYRLEKCREVGCLPCPMRYQPLDATARNSYLSPNWTEREMKDTQRYYFKLNWLGGITYEEYVSKQLILWEN